MDPITQPPLPTKKPSFTADRIDRLFAILFFPIGFLFIRWVFFSWHGWGVAVFTGIYATAIIAYLKYKNKPISKPGHFWFAALLLTGFSYALYDNNGLEPWRSFFLLCTAIYTVLTASGQLILKRTDNWILLDGLNGTFSIPFKNFGLQAMTLAQTSKPSKREKRYILPALLGIAFSLGIFAIVLPLLNSADSGGFKVIFDSIDFLLSKIQFDFTFDLITLVLAVPTSFYLFGLAAGSINNRNCDTFKENNIRTALADSRMLNPVTVYIVLAAVSLLYIVFIGSQLPYFFSAFMGRIPEGWRSYAGYARNGFFELLQITLINLLLLVAANTLSSVPRLRSVPLKSFNILISLLTLLLIAADFSKMALYISVYGLSVKRLLPCFFMVFLTIIFIAVILLQKKSFSIMRLAAVTGTILLCALFLINPDRFVSDYNAARYLDGTLPDFDVAILYRAESAGIDAALRVYGQTSDAELQDEILAYLRMVRYSVFNDKGTTSDTIQNASVRKKLEAVRF